MFLRRAICILEAGFKKTFSIIHRVGLAGKLILLFIAVLAIPVIAFGSYYIGSVWNNGKSEILESSRFFLKQVKFSVEKNAETCRRVAETVARNRKFNEYMVLKDISNITVEELIKFKTETLDNIENIQHTNLDIYQIRFFANKEDLFEIWPIIYNSRRIKSNDWFNTMMNENMQSYWQLNHKNDSFKTDTGTNEIVSFYRDVRYLGDQHAGVLEVSMLANIFFNEMYDDELDSVNSCLMVISSQNEFIFNGSGEFFTSRVIENTDSLQQELARRSNNEEGFFTFTLDGEEILCVYARVNAIDARLVRLVSYSELISSVNKARNLVLAGIVGVIIVLSLVTYFFLSVLLKKLRVIIATMRKVQEGDLHVDIPVFGNDEIGELAYHYRKMLDKIDELISVVVRKQTAEKNAEIRALQSQINSHFIYNILEAIRMMAEIKNEEEISNAVTCLGRLLRYSMSWNRQYVSLRDEVNYVKDYITLMNIRYDTVIDLVINIEEELLKQEVLKMLFQPIVENAVIHGIRNKDGNGVLSLTAYIEDEALLIEITDSGAGIGTDKLEELKAGIMVDRVDNNMFHKRTGIGLRNVNERIKLFYGSEFGLEIESAQNIYTKVGLRLQYKKGAGW